MKTIVDLVEEQKEYLLEKDTAAKQAVEANIAPVEADPSSASRAYVVGEQLFLNDVLYDVTSPISVGDAIAVGTNITAANKLSSDIKSKIDDLYLKDQAFMKQITVNGAVNELDHTGVTDTSGTVKFTVNEDKSITVSANSYPVTLDSTTTFFFFGTNSTAVPNIFKGKKFVGCPSGGASGTYRIAIQEFSSTTPSGAVAESSDVGEGANISNGDYIRMYIRLGSGYQLTSALTFKPMISLPELGLSYDDYVPYAKTNQELTAENQTLTNRVKGHWSEGGKNLLPFDIADIIASNTGGTWSGNTYTRKGITFTVNDDGSITCNGTATDIANVEVGSMELSNQLVQSYGTLILTGCPSGGSSTTYQMALHTTNGYIYDRGDGLELTSDMTFDEGGISVQIRSGYTASDLTFYPMIRLASITDDTYEPYAKTNRQLTKDAENITGLIDNEFENGCVNLLNNVASSTTTTDVTWVVNDDGTVTATVAEGVTTAAERIITIMSATDLETLLTKYDTLKIVGCPLGGSDTTGGYGIRCKQGSMYPRDNGYGLILKHSNGTITGPLVCQLKSGVVGSKTLTFKPMITLPTVSNSDYNHYVPYAKSNRELTEDVASLDAMYDGKKLNAVDDCDTPFSMGGTKFAINRFTTSSLNTPGGGGALLTWSSSANYGAQLAFNDAGVFYRKNSQGTISAWQNLIS